MPRITIDGRAVDVPDGGTILEAARILGIDIPAMCSQGDGYHHTSCMLCVVRVDGSSSLVPSCATTVVEGMEVESESDSIRNIRKIGLELLLSDHAGDCAAPCQRVCSSGLDVPAMLASVAAGDFAEAIKIIRSQMALPSVLARACAAPCEKACRRGRVDESVAINAVHQHLADSDLELDTPSLPDCYEASGKKVAIVGAGPTGLSAAWHLLQMGHECSVYDPEDVAGGQLRALETDGVLPPGMLAREVLLIERLGAKFFLRSDTKTGGFVSSLMDEFDAVILASSEAVRSEDLEKAKQGGGVLYVAGEAERAALAPTRAVGAGKSVAIRVDADLMGRATVGKAAEFNMPGSRVLADEMGQLADQASSAPRLGNVAETTLDSIRAEAQRCMHCECGQQHDCRLRHYAALYDARASRFSGDRRVSRRDLGHAEIVYDSGKCILCGACVRIAEKEGEALGVTFLGRGFEVNVDVPFSKSLAEGLTHAARACAEACPTGALTLRDR